MSHQQFKDRVCQLVARIPPGKVMTYGQMAALSGSPRSARIVGGIAHYGDDALPWHRVVNKRGGLAAGYPGGRRTQAMHLRAEGVEVDSSNIIKLAKYIWWPDDSQSEQKSRHDKE
jgi:methylated-DNA-protein-cysteine methyltransferase-like protein